MTRNWLTSASHSLRMTQPGTSSRRPRRTGLRVEGLETRLALSSYSTGPVAPALNPQPLPPGVVVRLAKVTPASDDWQTPVAVVPMSSAGTDITVRKAGGSADIKFSPDPTCGSCFSPTSLYTPPTTFSPDPTCDTCFGAELNSMYQKIEYQYSMRKAGGSADNVFSSDVMSQSASPADDWLVGS
jgi:hypothetical protein